jgi:hypothetical protein
MLGHTVTSSQGEYQIRQGCSRVCSAQLGAFHTVMCCGPVYRVVAYLGVVRLL